MRPSASPPEPDRHVAPSTPGEVGPRTVTRLVVLLAALALVAAACGPDSDSATTTTESSTAPASDRPATNEPGRIGGSGNDAGTTLQLRAEKITFSTTSLEAKAGQVTIGFDNRDEGVPHNLHVTGDGIDEKTDVEPGPVTQRLTLELGRGAYTYVCDVHPQQMTGNLVVT